MFSMIYQVKNNKNGLPTQVQQEQSKATLFTKALLLF